MNTEIRAFQNNIIAYINQSRLPLEVKRLIIRDVYIQLERMCENDAITQEKVLKEQEQKKTIEEVTE